jgi:hypothetical protein
MSAPTWHSMVAARMSGIREDWLRLTEEELLKPDFARGRRMTELTEHSQAKVYPVSAAILKSRRCRVPAAICVLAQPPGSGHHARL